MNAASRRCRTATPTTPIRLRSRRAGPRQRTRTPLLLGLAATVLASLLTSVSPAGAATPEATASKSVGRSDIGVALNDVVAAGVPGIIVRVQDLSPRPLLRRRCRRPRHRHRASAHRRVPGRKHHQDLRRHDRPAARRRRTPRVSTSPSPRRLPGLLTNGDADHGASNS